MFGIRLGQRKYLACLLIVVISLGFAVPVLALTPRDQIRPLIGGIQIEVRYLWWFWMVYRATCSMCFTAYWTEQTGQGTLYHYGFVTVSHGTNVEDYVYQPIYLPELFVGRTTIDPSFPRDSDSAFVETETVLNGPPSTILPRVFSCRSTSNYDYVVGYTPRSEQQIGEVITKVGRTTFCTSGPITAKIDSYEYDSPGTGEYIIINNPVVAYVQVEGGDSGGVIYRLQEPPNNPDYPGPALIYGIVCAYIFYEGHYQLCYSPTDGILNDLNIYVYEV